MSNTNSVTLHRVFKTPADKLFRAFTDPLAIAAWLPPYGYLCSVHELKVEVAGKHKMSFKNFTTGHEHSFGGEYLEVNPNELLKYTDSFDDPNLPGQMITTISFRQTSMGTEMKVLQEGIPSLIPTEACYLGWQESLDKLMRLVEPNLQNAP